MAEKLTQAELARVLGVSRQAIHNLVNDGKLVMDAEKRIDLDAARTAIAELHPGSKTAQAVLGGAAGAAPAAIVPTADAAGNASHVSIPAAASQFLADTDANGMSTNYHVARTLREMEEARMAKIKREEMEGQVIRITAVEAAWAESLAQAREKLLQLSIRLAPMLAVESDPLKIDTMLQAEMNEALQMLAGCDARPKPAEGSV